MSKKQKEGTLLEKQKRVIYGEGPKFGEVLKYYRKKRKLTQSEVSEGISCYSYFSKVENNVMEPSDQFIEDVSKRLGVDLSFSNASLKDNQLIFQMIKAYFYHRIDDLKALRISIKELMHPPSEKLLELCIAVSEGDGELGDSIVGNMRPLIENMDYLSANFLIILSAKHYFSVYRFSEAYKILKNLDFNVSINEYLDCLKHEISFLVKLKLNMHNETMYHYDWVIKSYQKNPNPSRILMIEIYRIIALAKENPLQSQRNLDKILTVYHELINDNMVIYALFFIKKQQGVTFTMEHYELLNHKHKDYWYFSALNLFEPMDFKRLEILNQVAATFDYHGQEFPFELVRFRLELMEGQTYKNYLNDIALPMAIEYELIDWIDHYTERLANLLIEQKRYKEAMGVYKKRSKILKKIKPCVNL